MRHERVADVWRKTWALGVVVVLVLATACESDRPDSPVPAPSESPPQDAPDREDDPGRPPKCRTGEVREVPEGPGAATGSLTLSLRIETRGPDCRFRGRLALTLTDEQGTELAVRGNPALVRFDGLISRRPLIASWIWRNWCGGGERFTFFVNGLRTAERRGLDGGPRCDVPDAASVLVPIKPWPRGFGGHRSPRPGSTTVVVADCFRGSVHPRRMTLACADNGFRAFGLSWNRWSGGRARGRGIFRTNDCDPGCPSGTWHRREGAIVLSERRYCLELDRYVFMSGRVVFDTPVRGRVRRDIYPGCPI